MSASVSNPQNKKTIYRSTDQPGVRSIWDWDEKRQTFVQRKFGNRYQANIEINGRAHSGSFRSIHEALEWRNRKRYEMERSPLKRIMSFRELIAAFLEFKKERVQVSTLESYRCLSKHFEWLGDRNVEDINSHVIDEWLREVKSEGYRSKMRSCRVSFEHEVTLLKVVFTYYREYFNEAYENPVRRRHNQDCVVDLEKKRQREAKRKAHYIPTADIERFLECFRTQATAKPAKLMYLALALVQLRSGLRVGEVCALDWKDINWDSYYLHVIKTVQWTRTKHRPSRISQVPKNCKFRRVKLPSEVIECLRSLQVLQQRTEGLIFSQDGLKIATYRSIQHHFNMAFQAAGLPWVSTHILRHSFATHFLEVTKNPLALKDIMGHGEMRMTEKYGKVTEEVTREATEIYERALDLKNVIPFRKDIAAT